MSEFPSTINVLSHWIQLFISLFVTQADALASERNILLMTVHSVFSRMTSQYNVSRLHTVCAAGFCPLNPSKPLKILRKYFFFQISTADCLQKTNVLCNTNHSDTQTYIWKVFLHETGVTCNMMSYKAENLCMVLGFPRALNGFLPPYCWSPESNKLAKVRFFLVENSITPDK